MCMHSLCWKKSSILRENNALLSMNCWISQEHRELAREAVRKSLVLLKNGKSPNKPMLPLPKKAGKILVTGSHANSVGLQCGGWTIEWYGGSGNLTDGAYTSLCLFPLLSFAFEE